MAIKPILFNTEMVRAILDGRKTCTRRICKDANEYTVPDMEFYNADKRTYAVHNFADKEQMEQLSTVERTCPICPGDILYVRETWSEWTDGYLYKAWNSPFPQAGESPVMKWHPSIHMPKEAARIWLKVTDVRVERLQDITYDGALREGAQGIRCDHVAFGEHGCTDCMNTGWIEPPQVEFMQIWNSTIKKSDIDRYGWDANPYVWVIEFERCEKLK
ncbi:MAG: hypothetical protein EGR48_00565 [Lachnospiraceae bacterium]|jgi:hypothetical protein|nr:hypothetical protein [Lachnospiraceae bacterium]